MKLTFFKSYNLKIKKFFQVVSALLEFLYTGEMTVDRSDTADLQRLIETLQIDPDLITVDVVDKISKAEKVEKSATTKQTDKENPPTEAVDEKKDKAESDTDDKCCKEKNDDPTRDEVVNESNVDETSPPPIIKKRKLDDDQESENVDNKKSKNWCWTFFLFLV